MSDYKTFREVFTTLRFARQFTFSIHCSDLVHFFYSNQNVRNPIFLLTLYEQCELSKHVNAMYNK